MKMNDPLPVVTQEELIRGFHDLGVGLDLCLMVHSSLRSLGYVVNGPYDVIDAILHCIGDGGTLVVPTHTSQLTEPGKWIDPSIRKEDLDKLRTNSRLFDKNYTLPRNRGIISTALLTYPGVCRSIHPLNSVAGLGPHAKQITSKHPLHAPEGIESPVGKLYLMEGSILLIGVTLTSCSVIHLAEYLVDAPYLKDNAVEVLAENKDGKKSYIRLKRYPSSSEHFDKLIPELKLSGILKEAIVGASKLLFMEIKPMIELVLHNLDVNPKYLLEP